MTTEEMLKYYGTAAKAMEALGLTRKTVYGWGEYPPLEVQCMIEVLTGGALRADRRQLSLRLMEGARYRSPKGKRKVKKGGA